MSLFSRIQRELEENSEVHLLEVHREPPVISAHTTPEERYTYHVVPVGEGRRKIWKNTTHFLTSLLHDVEGSGYTENFHWGGPARVSKSGSDYRATVLVYRNPAEYRVHRSRGNILDNLRVYSADVLRTTLRFLFCEPDIGF